MAHVPDLAVVPSLRSERSRAAGGRAHEDVLVGLRAKVRRLPSRLLYDSGGAELLQQLWLTEAFYPAHRERALLRDHAPAIAAAAGPRARVIEPCHGDLDRTIAILSALDRPALYLPIDGDPVRLAATTAALRAALPAIEIEPAVTLDEALPRAGDFERTVALLPGTTIGSLQPSDAVRLLTLLSASVGDDGMLLLGADANSDPGPLVAAYSDPAAERWIRHAVMQLAAQGVGIDGDAFAYATRWNPASTRLDLVLEARHRHAVVVGNEVFELEVGEALVVDHRHQHASEAVQAMLGIAGWQARSVYTSSPEPMRLWLCDRWRRHRRR